MKQHTEHLNELVVNYARRDFPLLRNDQTVQQALDAIRREGVQDRIIYFYVVDEEQRLLGVLPTRRLLTGERERRLDEVMISRVVAIPRTATVLEACEMFVMHKFLAFPVVDDQRHVLGVVDVSLLTDELLDLEERQRAEELFEATGFRISQLRDASPWRAFRFRFPWLLATIASGTLCALLAGVYEMTLAQSLVLAFFLTLVLGLGESVSVQSMTMTIQALRTQQPSLPWYLRTLKRELGTAVILGLACGALVAAIVVVWRGPSAAAPAIGLSILLSLCAACVLGLSVPSLLHALKLDPKIAAGPVTLALTDLCTLLFYFNAGKFLLGN